MEQAVTFRHAVFGSVATVAWFTYHVYYPSAMATGGPEFLIRVASIYLITLFVCALLLSAVHHFPVWTETGVALKRMIIVALPASFAATVVDRLR
jgi:hypothetical protein